jgi:hypothetical protein
VAEVGVDAVGLVGAVTQLGVSLALGDRRRVDGLVGGLARRALGGAFGRLLRERAVGARDGALDQLPVQGAVDDDRAAVVESSSTPAARA